MPYLTLMSTPQARSGFRTLSNWLSCDARWVWISVISPRLNQYKTRHCNLLSQTLYLESEINRAISVCGPTTNCPLSGIAGCFFTRHLCINRNRNRSQYLVLFFTRLVRKIPVGIINMNLSSFSNVDLTLLVRIMEKYLLAWRHILSCLNISTSYLSSPSSSRSKAKITLFYDWVCFLPPVSPEAGDKHREKTHLIVNSALNRLCQKKSPTLTACIH